MNLPSGEMDELPTLPELVTRVIVIVRLPSMFLPLREDSYKVRAVAPPTRTILATTNIARRVRLLSRVATSLGLGIALSACACGMSHKGPPKLVSCCAGVVPTHS